MDVTVLNRSSDIEMEIDCKDDASNADGELQVSSRCLYGRINDVDIE